MTNTLILKQVKINSPSNININSILSYFFIYLSLLFIIMVIKLLSYCYKTEKFKKIFLPKYTIAKVGTVS